VSGFILYDDATARAFEPFALTRPAGELRAGSRLVRERWAQVLGCEAMGFVGAPHLAMFEEPGAPRAAVGTLPAGTIIVNARCAPALTAQVTSGTTMVTVGTRIAAIRLAADTPVAALADGHTALESLGSRTGVMARAEGWWLDAPWDLVRHLPEMLTADIVAELPTTPNRSDALTVLGSHPVHIDPSATVEPMVVIDASAGPVLVRGGAVIQAFTRLVGPCVIDTDVVVAGGRVACCSIGERSKVHGELSVTILIGHANKGHDGFVGHSVIGRWANLGAGTITSNLKNSYGPVSCWSPSGMRDTGMQFLGSLIGDHVKTGIGTRLTTGGVIGAGANCFGTPMPPKVVAPFAWGEAAHWELFALDKFLEVADRMMQRRGRSLSAEMRGCLTAAHAARWSV
jgi:UDP-N-acetylglucosamine diphosphorylase/glucosamine-1-phosphate N-acetyltransferase